MEVSAILTLGLYENPEGTLCVWAKGSARQACRGGGRKKALFNQIKYFEVSCEAKGFPQKKKTQSSSKAKT